MSLSLGIDLVSVDSVAESIARHSDRYLERIYTDGELADCRDAAGGPLPERLASRFAAKEALMKALRPARDDAIPWRQVAVRSDRSGAPALELCGRAQAVAQRRGVRSLALSMTHERGYAAAVVVAEIGEDR
jgi:holo-[acyl-carrier protein] synthase